jgi:hypothetical protein
MDGSVVEVGFADISAVLDGSGISHRGMMLMGYQRTGHVSRKARLAWEAGDPTVMEAEVATRRDQIFAEVTAAIAREHRPVRDYLLRRGLAPRQVVDIGCGAAVSDALLRLDFALKATLIDIEETPEQYHFWNANGAGYASLQEATAFLRKNGFKAGDITAINPRKTPKALAKVSGDLVTSFFSCGFHYPVTEYIDLMRQTMEAGGTVILDLRGRYLASPDAALTRLIEDADVEILLEMPKSKRMAFRKPQAA